MKHWMVVLALLLTAQSAAAQWRPDSSTGGLSGPKRYLTVASREGNARLLVWCSEPVTFQLNMDQRLGIFLMLHRSHLHRHATRCHCRTDLGLID